MSVTIERSERLELVATVLLGVATIASAWCTYQSELWNSEQLEHMAAANVLESESVRATDVSTRNAVIDATTFANMLQVAAQHDQRAVEFLRARARPEFRTALDAWLATRTDHQLPPGTPFQDPRYREAVEGRSINLAQQAVTILKSANAANANSDRFQMRTVLLAMSLFFLGIAGQLNTRVARRIAVLFGAVVLVLTLISLAHLPLATPPSRLRGADADHTRTPE